MARTVSLSEIGPLAEMLRHGVVQIVDDDCQTIAEVIPSELPPAREGQTLEERLDVLVEFGRARRGTGNVPEDFFSIPRGRPLPALLADRSAHQETTVEVAHDEKLAALFARVRDRELLTITYGGEPVAEIGPPRQATSVEELVAVMVDYGIQRGGLNAERFRMPHLTTTSHLEMLLEAIGIYTY